MLRFKGTAASICHQVGWKRTPVDGVSGEGRTVETSWQNCQARCARVPGCVYFSMWRDGGCHLQGPAAVLEAASGVTTGPKHCSADPDFCAPYPNALGQAGCHNLLSPTVQNLDVQTCKDLCRANPSCTHAVTGIDQKWGSVNYPLWCQNCAQKPWPSKHVVGKNMHAKKSAGACQGGVRRLEAEAGTVMRRLEAEAGTVIRRLAAGERRR